VRAVVLLSGGLDSYTAAAIARAEGYSLCALTINYGQRHERELAAARRVASALAVEKRLEIEVDLRGIGASALTASMPVPRHRDLSASDIPITYVPARNTIFLALALAWAEALGARDLVIGVNALDLDYGLTHSCYDPLPDGSPCTTCDSCVLRSRGFAEAGIPDPLILR
jgi:7-cyano-7-deazaguanine synthase